MLDQCDKTYVSIYTGEVRTLNLRVVFSDCTNFDLTGIVELCVKFPKNDGSYLLKKLSAGGVTIVDALHGKFSVLLTATDTASLKIGERQTIWAEFDFGVTNKRIAEFDRILTVKEYSLCS